MDSTQSVSQSTIPQTTEVNTGTSTTEVPADAVQEFKQAMGENTKELTETTGKPMQETNLESVQSFNEATGTSMQETNLEGVQSFNEATGTSMQETNLEGVQSFGKEMMTEDIAQDTPLENIEEFKNPFGDLSEKGTDKPTLNNKNEEEMKNAFSGRFGEGAAGVMNMGQSTPAIKTDNVEAVAETVPMSLSEIEGIVNQILVNSPEDGAPEVKLMIDNPSLKGTEISLTRGNDGLLRVVVETTDYNSFQTLVGAQNKLVETLQSKEAKMVQVEIRDTKNDQSAEGGQNDRDRAQELWEAYRNNNV